jgi:vitamin B12 transporter
MQCLQSLDDATTLDQGDCMDKKTRHAAAAVCLALAATAAHAQKDSDTLNEVVVTATRAAEGIRADLLGSSFTILPAQTLEQRQTRIVSDVLRDVPGISVSRSGTVGGQTQVRMRGAEGNHTLVMIDGIEASDPFIGSFDFATLIADDVARVEVLRGQQSALYGSDAIGGVINYITLSGREAPGIRTRIEGGSFGSMDVSTRVAGVSNAFDYALSAGYQSTDGVPTSRFGTRDIGSDNTAASVRLGYEANDVLRFKAIARYSRTDGDANDQDFGFPPGPTYGYVIDSDDEFEYRALYGLVRGELDTFDDRWTHALSAQTVDAKRDNFSGGGFDNGDEGNRQRFSYESTLRFGTEFFRQTVTAAFDHEREEFQNRGVFLTPEQTLKRDITNEGIVLQYDASVDERIGFGAALRRDDNNRFDDDETFRVQGSYRFDSGTRLRAAAGSGIKNPDIFELFGFDPGSFVGNPDLKPEKSNGWEAGVEQAFAQGRAKIGVTWFDNKLEDEIATVFLPTFVFGVENIETQSTQTGVEVAFSAQPSSTWSIDAAYTYLDAEEDGREEVRRPPHIASLNVGWRAAEDRGGVALTVRYNGEMFDSDFTDPFDFNRRVQLPAYTLVNLGADWKLSAGTQLYARVENLLDEEYEEVFTYRTHGTAVYAGARFTFR